MTIQAISTKNTVLAAVVETTEGTPVVPTSATQYVTVQGDLAFKPDFNVLTNAEVVASIGMRQSILGSEKPSATFSHYLKHSGTEGTAPEWSNIMKSAFGTQTTIASEEQTSGSSTVTTLNITSGHGVNVSRGQGVLIKDGTHGYSIRAVDSISTDALSLSFDLANAPATTTKLGKPIFFSPAQTGHIALSLWRYLNQGGAIEMISGSRCTGITVKGTAGELINSSLQFAGIQYYLDPITSTSSKSTIDWTDDSGTYAATIAVQTYKDPVALALAVQTAMQGTATTKTPTCTYDSTAGTFTFKATGTVLSLLWNTGTNTAISLATLVGFSTAADNTGTGATTGYTGSAITMASPQTPTLDSTQPLAAKNQEVLIGLHNEFVAFDASEVTIALTNTRTETKSIVAATGVSGSVFTGRAVKVTIKSLLPKYMADKFDRFVNNTSLRMQWSFGNKSGGNWVAGQCGYAYLPTCSATKFDISNQNDLAMLNLELAAFVDATGSGELYLGFL